MAHTKAVATRDGGEVVPLSDVEEERLVEQAAAGLLKAPVIKFDNLRNERNQRLAETDWFANSDVDMGANMATYRQQLRDLPAQYNNETIIGSVVWPVKPE